MVGLDVRPLGHREAHVGEDGSDLVDHLAHRVNASFGQRSRTDRQRDVDGLAGEAGVEGGGLQHRLAIGNGEGHTVLQRIDRSAARTPLVRAHGTERLQQRRYRPLLAEGGDAHAFEGGFVTCGVDVVENGGFELFDVGHDECPGGSDGWLLAGLAGECTPGNEKSGAPTGAPLS